LLPSIITIFPYTTLFRSENVLVISKNGENYFITNTIKDKKTGKTEEKNPMPAAVSKNGLLQLNAGAGMVDFAIDEKTGNLVGSRSEEHTSELQSRENLVC